VPQPQRVENPSELSDEALGCHVLGHLWWVTRAKDAGISIGKEPQKRLYFACRRGCGCTKKCLTDTDDGERWGWSRRQGEKYGTDWRMASLPTSGGKCSTVNGQTLIGNCPDRNSALNSTMTSTKSLSFGDRRGKR
jgi:hypothetical protein